MGALVGIWSREKGPIPSFSIHKMAEKLKLCEQDRISVFEDEHLSLGYIYQHSRPLRHNICQNEEFYLLCIGDTLNHQELVQTLKRDSSTKGNYQAEILLRLFEQKKEDFASELNGTFAVVVYDKKSHELTLANDRLGQIRIYYTETKDKIIFSSKAKAILAHEEVTAKVNETSLLDLFLFRSLMDNESLFEDIHLLPPASLWRVSEFGIKKREYWSLEDKLSLPPEFKKKRECYERTRTLFNQAVQRTLVGDLTFHLGLTSGLDSRCILSAIEPNSPYVICFTRGSNNDPDVVVGRELAGIYGLKHEHKKIGYSSTEDFKANLQKSVYLAEGLSNMEAAIYLDTVIEVRENSTSARQITGTLGTQTMRTPLFLGNKRYFFPWLENALIGKVPVRHKTLTFFFDRMFGSMMRLYVGIPEPLQFFNKHYLEMARDRYHAVNHRNYQKADRVNLTSIRGKLHYIALKHLIQNCFPARNPLCELYYRTPFIDNDFFEHMLQVPLSMKSELKMVLHRYIVEKNSPVLTSVPYYNKTRIASFDKTSLKAWKSRLSKDTPKTILSELGQRIRRDLKEFTTDLLLKGDIWCANFFNEKYVKSLVQDHIAGKINATYTIANLINIEMWHRIFFASSSKQRE